MLLRRGEAQARIDELPQLWAWLFVRMSLISSPAVRSELQLELEQQIPHYGIRLEIRPRLRGWAKVNYPYGASIEDASNNASYDRHYLRSFCYGSSINPL